MVTANRFFLSHVKDFSDYRVVNFWKDMKTSGLLRSRMIEVAEPSLRDVEEMLADKTNACFVMWDAEKGKIAAETMLNNFRGLAAQVHFSIHPIYHGPIAVQIAREGAEQHFNLKSEQTGDCLTTLIGLTPADNRLAIKFIKRVGFKVLDKVDKMFYNAKSKKYVDGYLSKLTSESMYGR